MLAQPDFAEQIAWTTIKDGKYYLILPQRESKTQ